MNSNIKRLSQAGDDFIKHKSSMILFISLVIGAGLLNIILFSFGQVGVKSPFLPEEGNSGIMVNSSFAWIAWTSLITSMIGSSFDIWAFVLIIRKDKKFIFPLVIGAMFSIPNEFFLGAIFSALCFTILFFVEIWTYFQWKKDDLLDHKTLKTNYLVIFILWLTFIVVCFSLIFTIDFFTQGGENYLIPILDVTTASVVLVCWTMTLRKNKWGLIGIGFTDISYIIIYVIQGSMALAMTFFIYILMDIVSFLGWSKK